AEPVHPAARPVARSVDIEQEISSRAGARFEDREPVRAEEATAAPPSNAGPPLGGADEDGVARVVHDLAAEEGATFQSSAALYREFALRCRQRGVPSGHIDMVRFRRSFAHASAGLGYLEAPLREAIERLAEKVPDDVLAPYLAIAAAAAQGRAMPDEDEVARVYGSSSPSRIRRLLDHLERQGLISVREEFGGERTITVSGLEAFASP
ncbi:MAG: ATP-binding protein, partial [Alphaproteobacteria bacterium]|nr:ATP-binding protein [Alphaproteobacteria bacterium]